MITEDLGWLLIDIEPKAIINVIQTLKRNNSLIEERALTQALL